MDYEKWVALGERLGLKDKALAEYVEKKEAAYLEREERLRQRTVDAERRELERQIEARRLEAEEKRRDEERRHQFETERMEKEAALRREQQEHEAKRLEIELQMLRLKAEMSVSTDDKPIHDQSSSNSKSLRPKLPKFDESKDDMDAYIERFERFAKSQGWSEDTWAVSLSTLLTGKGLNVYTSMPADQADDYQALKKAVLKRYMLTEEGFRLKFRDSKPEQGETVFQFVARIRRYFNRWIEMAEVEDSFEDLVDLMLREQFVKQCSAELALFLKERVPKSVADMTRLAEQYIEAHGGSISSNKGQATESKATNPKSAKSKTSANKSAQSQSDPGKDSCYNCGKKGHFSRDCRFKKGNKKTESSESQKNQKVSALSVASENVEEGMLKLANGDRMHMVSSVCTIETLEGDRNLHLQKGYVGDRPVRVLRDTGCELAAVRPELVQDDQWLDKKFVMITIEGAAKIVNAAKIVVDTPYYSGELEVMVPKTLICDLVLGNHSGVRDTPAADWRPKLCSDANEEQVSAAVMTRAQAEKEKRPITALNVPKSPESELTVDVLRQSQKDDKTLDKIWEHASTGKRMTTKSGNTYWYEVKKHVLYRMFEVKRNDRVSVTKQIVVPSQHRRRVMELAHESIVGGHLSAKKTEDRIMSSFHWPGITSDVTNFCRSCDICQKTIPKGRVSKVPLGEMPIMETPFHRVAVDLIGPIAPVSEKGNRYILTIVDYATRYPEAVALPKIETERVAEALMDVFCRVGFPTEILSDRGTQFTSDLMKEVSRLVSVKQLFTTPYNPKCNGLCERMNGVLKSMLKKMCQERPKDWDRYLSAVLFAYREVPQASTGFSPFELLYGRNVRGPMQVLKELWTNPEVPEARNTYEYVLDLKQRLIETCQIARESLLNAQGIQKHHYDKRTKRRQLNVGDKVLVLLPTDHNKLVLQWKGPFDVVEVVGKMDYKVRLGHKESTFHINLLKKYEERQEATAATVAVVEAENDDDVGVIDHEELLELPSTSGSSETYEDVTICPKLSTEQKAEVQELVEEYQDIFSERPGRTKLGEHTIRLTSSEPIRVKQYPIPYAKRRIVDEEVNTMLNMGIIEPSQSEYNSPIVLVNKKDGSSRFCIDFRKLNSVTVFDSEPMTSVDDILAGLKDDKFFTKIDLAKGYWQIPVQESMRHVTSFSTQQGTFQFKKMPFGMVNSGATFNRMMRKLLEGCENTDNYVDDILGHTRNWSDHLAMLRKLFERVRSAGLTIRPSKCYIGFGNIGFTGHSVGNGTLAMEEDKLSKIRDAERPETKRQVRAFLGLAGYYRKFIPSFAETAAPLTDLTKKGNPNKVMWKPEHEHAFVSLKQQLSRAPILRLPDLSRQFILQTDASDLGVGAALMQKFDDGTFPIAYASKKLLPRERNYSVIEKECLAIVFGIKRFQKYVYGRDFVIQTDHAPLSFIKRAKVESGRIMRWAMFLQNYSFRIEAIKGSDNVCADYLSRQ